MNSLPLISIVLPTYNGSRYLCESIDSCLRQTVADWELIIVDDASTDGTPAIIARYVAQDGRIRSIRNPVNSKLPRSLNIGFAQARGRFLTWTSDDNCYQPDALQQMAGFLEAHPRVDVVYANYTVIDSNGAPTQSGLRGAGSLAELPFRNVVGACFLYRKAVHERLGGYAEDLPLAEDYDFWLRASCQVTLTFLNKDLCLYRLHERSLTETQTTAVALAREKSLARNLPRLPWNWRVRGKVYDDLIDKALKRRDSQTARSYLQQALRRNPLLLSCLRSGAVADLVLPAPLKKLVHGWEARKFRRRVRRTIQEVTTLIPPNEPFILVDEDQLRGGLPHTRVVPFLESGGEYCGPPADDASAIREFERLRNAGASYIIFAWPAFWWLDYYTEFRGSLQEKFRCVVKNELLVIFDLR